MNKYELLIDEIKKLEKVCVAFSGGVDSAFLLHSCKVALGENVKAVIAKGAMVSTLETDEAISFCKKYDIHYEVIEVFPLSIKEFEQNDKKRCYFCKKFIFTSILEKAAGYKFVLDGQNADDANSYRPGAKACEELKVVSPLKNCSLTKSEIREFSKSLDLPTWNKPTNSCLVTRIPYNTLVTEEMLKKVENCEKILESAGIIGGRARIHADILRIEISKQYFDKVVNNDDMITKLKETGFKYITLDLEGFRSGSMD